MRQLLRPFEIRTFKEKSFITSQLQRQYTTQFQCTICCFINQDLVLAEIHQMSCLLQQKLKQKQNLAIVSRESSNQKLLPHENFKKASQKNDVKKENKQVPSLLTSSKFDMMQYLGLQSFQIKYNSIYRKEGGYICTFCKCRFHLKTRAIRHQNNSHFLEIQEMLQFTYRKDTQNSLSLNFYEILFKPFAEQSIFTFYKCKYCSYTSKQKYRLHQHLSRFCSHLNSQHQDYQITVAKESRKEKLIKKECKSYSIQNVKLGQDQEENHGEIKRACGDKPVLQNVKKQQEDV